MREYNEVMNKYYDPEKCVFFENALQSNAYIFRGNAELQAVLVICGDIISTSSYNGQ